MLSLDLHGCTVKNASIKVQECFYTALEQGFTELYFITGYGSHVNADGSSGVLKKILPKLFEPFKNDILKVEKESCAYKVILKKKLTFQKTITDAEKTLKSFINLLKNEANNADDESQLIIATYYLESDGANKDEILAAIKTLESLESKGMVEAGVALARCLLQSASIERNPKRAIKILEKYLNQSDNAKFDLAKVLLQGEGLAKNEERGRKMMLELAQNNYAPACCTVGESYLSGDYTEKNDSLGVKFLQRAAVQNYSPAFVLLARCYGAGQGIAQNDKLALNFYKKAAEFNNPYAYYQLGRYYNIGKGVAVDLETSFKYFLRAAQLGDSDAAIEVATMYIKGEGVHLDFAQGIQWLKTAVDKYYPEACYIYGCMLIDGKLLPKNINEGMKHLKSAVKKNHPLAMLSLALTILSNQHSQEDKNQAFELLEQSHPMTSEVMPFLARVNLANWHFKAASMFFKKSESIHQSIFILAYIFTSKTKDKIDLGLLLAEYCASAGFADAQWFMIDVHFKKIIPNLIPDYKKGLECLHRLSEKNDPAALYLLGFVHFTGEFGLTQNPMHVLDLMQRAKLNGSAEADKFLKRFDELMHQEIDEDNNTFKPGEKTLTKKNNNDSNIASHHIPGSTAKPALSHYSIAGLGIGLLGIASVVTYNFLYKRM